MRAPQQHPRQRTSIRRPGPRKTAEFGVRMSESGSATKRHNPVESIRRKIKTIELRDQESNPHLQIPKFQSRNFDSPQSSTKKDLEEVLKNRAMKNTSKDLVSFSSPGAAGSPALRSPQPVTRCDSPLSTALYSANMAAKEQNKKLWSSCGSQSCSTPLEGPGDTRFRFQPALPGCEYKGVILEDRILGPVPSFYYDRKSDHFTLKSPVVKRLSMSESAGLRRMVEPRPEPAGEVSLICEEDLLNSIFHACDPEHRGKVAVSKIVDYLRHTTSRGSEDSGLSDLCHMLDPDSRDISMDLDTYHAIMREWVDDCRNNGTENRTRESVLGAEDSMMKLREGLLAVRRISGTTMNITCGSLEAFGGDVSRGDLDTSDLITCVADLQYNNHKLQEQHSKLKAAIEAQEESNHRLLEENEELRNQWKSAQQSVSRVRSLKSELEEVKLTVSSLEESRSRLVAHNKQLEKENLSLVHQVGALQEENLRGALEVEETRKTLSQVTDKAAELQLQLTDYESALQKKDAASLLKDLYVEEMKATLMEYRSVIENLRIEKSKLENNLQQLEQELLSNGINSPVTKLSQVLTGGPNSLHTELEYAQHSLEVSTADWICSTGRTSSLDVTLDREVLLLLQGPGHEQIAAEFRTILQALQEDTNTRAEKLLRPLQHLIESDIDVKDLSRKMLEVVQKDLRERRKIWEQKLKDLEKHKDSLDKEFAKLSGNLRRMKTEQLHLRKELTTRLHDLEAARHQQEEAEGREATVLAELQHSTSKQEDLTKQIDELEGSLHAARSETEELQRELAAARRQQEELQAAVEGLTSSEQTASEPEGTVDRLQDPQATYELGVQESSCFPGRLPAAPPLGYTPGLDTRSPEGGQRAPKPDPESGSAASAPVASVIPERTTSAAVGVQTDEKTTQSPEMEKPSSEVICAGSFLDSVNTTSVSRTSPTSTASSAPSDHTSADAETTKRQNLENKDGGEKRIAAEEASTRDGDKDGGCEPEGEKRPTAEDGSAASLVMNAAPAEEICCPNNEKEMETEFLRLSLGFKCDLFTLEKRLRLEERSRELAEENLRKELTSCKKLLEALTPLCEDDNQTHEIVKKLEKSLQFLSQHSARVASRSEMLGAIHQESRVSKAVDVMIQHVENLKRTYAKEHAELEELREALQQNERSASTADREDSLKLTPSLASKVSPARRVSMPAYPRGAGSPMDIFGGDKLDGKLQHRRSNSWKLVGSRQNDRPTLQRFVDNYTRPEPSEENAIKEDEASTEVTEDVKEERSRKYSCVQKLLPTTTSDSAFGRIRSWTSALKRRVADINKPLVVSALAVVLLVTLLSFLTGLSFHKAVDGAPVGTGASWTSVQQLLWPYTGLHHNAPPPV